MCRNGTLEAPGREGPRFDRRCVRQKHRAVEPCGPLGHSALIPTKGLLMPKYNRKFDLTLNDIDLLEAALRVVKRDLSLGREGARALLPVVEGNNHEGEIDDLLGRLHNQKIFYRPSNEPYVSG